MLKLSENKGCLLETSDNSLTLEKAMVAAEEPRSWVLGCCLDTSSSPASGNARTERSAGRGRAHTLAHLVLQLAGRRWPRPELPPSAPARPTSSHSICPSGLMFRTALASFPLPGTDQALASAAAPRRSCYSGRNPKVRG